MPTSSDDRESKNFRYALSRLRTLRAQEGDPAAQRAYDRAISEVEKAFLLPRFD